MENLVNHIDSIQYKNRQCARQLRRNLNIFAEKMVEINRGFKNSPMFDREFHEQEALVSSTQRYMLETMELAHDILEVNIINNDHVLATIRGESDSLKLSLLEQAKEARDAAQALLNKFREDAKTL